MPALFGPRPRALATPQGVTACAGDAAWRRYQAGAVLAALALLGAFALVRLQGSFDHPVTLAINALAGRWLRLDRVMADLNDNFLPSGVLLMALVWACWFADDDAGLHGRMLSGLAATTLAGALSRWCQHVLPSHPRPVFDPALTLRQPLVAGANLLNTWNSFPSDHMAVFAGLAAVVALARPRLGLLAGAWLAAVETSRIFMGEHTPSDLLGGAALACLLVWLAQAPPLVALGSRAAAWKQHRPALFYALAFLASEQLATLFVDLRQWLGTLLVLVGLST